MSAATETKKVRFAVPTLVGAVRYPTGEHPLPSALATALVDAGDASRGDDDEGGGDPQHPTDAQLTAADAAQAQRAADEAKAKADAEAEEKAAADAKAQADAEAEAKAAADAEAEAKAAAQATAKKAGGKK